MHLLTFSTGNGPRLGVLDPETNTVIDLNQADSSLPRGMNALIALGGEGLDRVRKVLAGGKNGIPLADVKLLAPIPHPRRNVICVGKNYYDHAHEFDASGFDSSAITTIPEFPVIFTKASNSVIGTGEAILASLDSTNSTDYEGELGVVIGEGGRNISKADAYDHVYGYTVINDVTARDLQKKHAQWFIGKSVDTYCPMGPALVTADEVGDVTKCRLTTTVNGELRQDAVISDLIFDIPTLIETLSQTFTFEPGDIISTGTPKGVGIGFNPSVFLKKGDVVTVAIEGIGEITNSIA